MGGKSLSQDNLIGECFKNKFHPSKPQCLNIEVYKAEPLGNPTDDWTWCKEHVLTNGKKNQIIGEGETYAIT